MRIVSISDTHGLHDKLLYPIPEGDVLIHCGDICGKGTKEEVIWFSKWFTSHPHKHKIFIAGNHDWVFEKEPETIKSILQEYMPNVHYLQDSEITIDGIKFWGSPVQPTFFNWAFNRDRGTNIQQHWNLIPKDIDVLITHGPPYGVCDKALKPGFVYRAFQKYKAFETVHVGCEDLLKTVETVKPKLHLFGHIHLNGGSYNNAMQHTVFANVCIMDEDYKPVKKPQVFELDLDKKVTIINT